MHFLILLVYFNREARSAKYHKEKAEKEQAAKAREQEKLQKQAEEAARIAAANR